MPVSRSMAAQNSTSATNFGWRYAPSYYEMRDILGMFYQYS